MDIDDLFEEHTTSRAINKRYSQDIVDKYVAKLNYLIEQVTAGKIMPTRTKIVAHMKEKLGIDVTPASIGNHMEALRKDGFIWRR